jgi:hypothetical protein
MAPVVVSGDGAVLVVSQQKVLVAWQQPSIEFRLVWGFIARMARNPGL